LLAAERRLSGELLSLFIFL